MTPDDPRHGTVAGSVTGCRCEPCLTAKWRYEKQRVRDQANGRPRLLPSLGAARRVQALMALGWTTGQIGDQIGMSKDRVWHLLKQPYVRAATDIAVRDVYDRLSMKVGPSDITRRRAAARGWAVPLAWDEAGPHGIDNPNATPHVGSGSTPPPNIAAEIELHRGTDTAENIAARLGYKPASLARQLARLGRPDLAGPYHELGNAERQVRRHSRARKDAAA